MRSHCTTTMAIQNVGLRPNSYSIPFVLKACAHLTSTTTTMAIHAQAVGIVLCQDVHVQTAIIQTYAACGCLLGPRQIFDQMPNRDLISWSAILAAHVKFGDIETACKLFDEMLQKDVISWTALIAGYAQINQPNAAIMLYVTVLVFQAVHENPWVSDNWRGELALQHLMEVEPHNSGNYILLSKIYASLGR
ncbi:Pentatricopeptide repeat-containing protein [Nymphaea thermarum]|nr:Pentatricopeptide repeat-containing protein [Nymphaea thermarum]